MGHTAVDIFFVLSGFVLTCVYSTLRPSRMPLFWLRRICRVYPLHLAVLGTLAAMAIGSSLLHLDRHDHDWQSLGVQALLLQPFLPIQAPWNPPTWSVGIELLCYALFPFVILVSSHARVWTLCIVLIALVLIEVYVLHRYDGASSGEGGVLRGLVGFHIGLVLARISRQPGASFATPVSLMATAALVAGIVFVSPSAVVTAAAVLILALSAERGPVAWLLATRGSVWLGRVSFSIYLLHVPVLFVLQRVPLPGGKWSHFVLFVGTLLPLSELTYRWIERPGRRIPSLMRRHIPILA